MANITVTDTIVKAVLRSKVAYFSLLQKDYWAKRREKFDKEMAKQNEKHDKEMAKLREMHEEKLQWNEHQFQLEQQELAFQRTRDENRRKEFIENSWPLSLSPEDYLLMLKNWPNPSGLLPLNVIIPNQSFSFDTIDCFFHDIYNSNVSPIFERSGDWKDNFMKRLNGNALIQNLWMVFKIPTILVLSKEVDNDFVIKVSYWGMLDQEPPAIFQTFSMNLKDLEQYIIHINDNEDEIKVNFAKKKGECASWLINFTGCLFADMYFLSENDAQPKFSALLNNMPDFLADKKEQYADYLEEKFLQLIVNERQFLKEQQAESQDNTQISNLLENEEYKEDYQSKLLDVHKGKKFGYGCPALHAALIAKEFNKAGINEKTKIFIDWAVQDFEENIEKDGAIDDYKCVVDILKNVEGICNEELNKIASLVEIEDFRRRGGAMLGEDWKANLCNGVELEMVWVEPGHFEMGSDDDGIKNEKTKHKVNITKGFWIGKYQLTQEQWTSLGVRKKCENFFNKGGQYPVENISWYEANHFCNVLNEKLKDLLPEDYHFALPTEAQWEFAARGGIKTRRYKYSGSDNIDEVAWCYENYVNIEINEKDGKGNHLKKQKKNGGDIRMSHPIGQKKANELEIYDMSGNVWEWCRDCMHPLKCKKGCLNHVFCGGSWFSPAEFCHPSFHSCADPVERSGDLGFRVALVPVQ